MIKIFRFISFLTIILLTGQSWAGNGTEPNDTCAPSAGASQNIIDPNSCSRAPLYNKLAGDCADCPPFYGFDEAKPGCYVLKQFPPPNRRHSEVFIYDGCGDPFRTEFRAQNVGFGVFKHIVSCVKPFKGRIQRVVVDFIPLTTAQARECVNRIRGINLFGSGYVPPGQLTAEQFLDGTLDNPNGLANCHHYSTSVADAVRGMNFGQFRPNACWFPVYLTASSFVEPACNVLGMPEEVAAVAGGGATLGSAALEAYMLSGASSFGISFSEYVAATSCALAPPAAACAAVTFAGTGAYQCYKQSPSNGYCPSRGSWSTNYFDCFYDLYLDW